MGSLSCLPIVATSWEEVLERVAASAKHYDCFELWIDPLSDFTPDRLTSLLKSFSQKVIIVSRAPRGVKAGLSLEERIKLLCEITHQEVLFDLDSESQQEELHAKVVPVSKLLLSFHDYQGTPTTEELHTVVKKMTTFEPTHYKLACLCHEARDALRLLELLLTLKAQKKEYTVLGMGVHGLPTRIFGPLWGNRFNYLADEKGAQTAPGQLTREEYALLQEVLSARE